MESVYNARLPPLSSHGHNPASISGLPKQFVNSMRTLFDILDDENAGLVPLSEIERRWRDDAVPNLPGVLDSLRAVAPPDGLLSFEIFVWGLRSALARARQCREMGKVNINHSFKNALRIDQEPTVLPPYYYQSRGPEKPTQFGAKINNVFRQKDAHVESLRSGSYNVSKYNQRQPMTWQDKNDVTFGRYPMRNNKQIHFQPSNEGQYRSRSSGNRPGHRRSNSGPITTATILPSPQKSSWPHDYNSYNKYDVKMGLATKFAAERSPENLSDKENKDDSIIKKKLANEDSLTGSNICDKSINSLKSDPCSSLSSSASPVSSVSSNNRSREKNDDVMHDDVASQLSSKSDLDNVTANTLFINADSKNSFNKPIGLSGKYIGLTGTMQRTKSAGIITSQYGSLRRPAMSTPNTMITSASENNFTSITYDPRRRQNGVKFHKKEGISSAQRRQYASAGESGDESHNRVFQHYRTSSGERKRSAGQERSKDRAGPDGSGRRCNSASPPELPVQKSARSSTNPDLIEERKEVTPRPKSTGPENQYDPRQLVLPPPSARKNSRKAASPNGLQKSSEYRDPANPATYATMGRRKSGNSKRRDPRRHTVANGIDYNLIKCIKQLEQEKDVILQGMDALDRGKEWFTRRLTDVQERQMRLSNVGVKSESFSPENDLALSQNEIDNLLTKISKMQRLVQSMTQQNLETSPVSKNSNRDSPPGFVSALRDQNHILTNEVSRQTDQISQLEREKSVLVQQLFQAKAEAQCVDGQVNTSIFI